MLPHPVAHRGFRRPRIPRRTACRRPAHPDRLAAPAGPCRPGRHTTRSGTASGGASGAEVHIHRPAANGTLVPGAAPLSRAGRCDARLDVEHREARGSRHLKPGRGAPVRRRALRSSRSKRTGSRPPARARESAHRSGCSVEPASRWRNRTSRIGAPPRPWSAGRSWRTHFHRCRTELAAGPHLLLSRGCARGTAGPDSCRAAGEPRGSMPHISAQ